MRVCNRASTASLEEAVLFPFDPCGLPFRRDPHD